MPLERKEAEKIIRKKHFAEQKQSRKIEEGNIERKRNAKKILPFIVNGSYLSEEEIVEKTEITIGKVRQALVWLRFHHEIKVAEKNGIEYYGK